MSFQLLLLLRLCEISEGQVRGEQQQQRICALSPIISAPHMFPFPLLVPETERFFLSSFYPYLVHMPNYYAVIGSGLRKKQNSKKRGGTYFKFSFSRNSSFYSAILVLSSALTSASGCILSRFLVVPSRRHTGIALSLYHS